jgi:hypothetical protein
VTLGESIPQPQLPADEPPMPLLGVGQTLRHHASHNRYQIYTILEVRTHPEANCRYSYLVHFREYADSQEKTLRDEYTTQLPEVTLPIPNQIPW